MYIGRVRGVSTVKVSNQPIANQAIATEQSLDLKQGEVYKATVKERISSNEAILQIRGKEVHAKFEGNVPQGDRVTVQVMNQQEGTVEVRSLTETPKQSSSQPTDVGRILRNLGTGSNPSPELREAARMLLDRGMPLTKEVVQELKTFLEREKGTIQQKLDTIQAIANKRLNITPSHLRSVHEALHGRPLHQAINDLTKDISARIVGNSNDSRGLETRLAATRIMEQLPLSGTRSAEGRPSEAGSVGSAETQKGSTTIGQVIQQVQREANLERVLELVRAQVISNPAIHREIINQVDKAVNEATQLQHQGRELAARQQIIQALSQTPTVPVESNQQQYVQNEQFQTSQQLSTKDFVVAKVTQKLAQAAQEFTELKRDVSRGLDHTARLIQELKSAIPQAKQMLSTTIDKLDKAILKSELTMLTDMKSEKQLMQASSQLAEAKRLLGKGDFSAAHKMVQDVKVMLDKLKWQPSETKVQHFVMQESKNIDQARPAQQLINQFEETTRPLLRQEPSARQMFEIIRGLGLNHDSEVARTLTLQKESAQQDGGQRNMKAILMQLMRAESEQGRIHQSAEQALNNLTGQQLLSRNDPANNLQSLFFNIPFLLEDKLENLQVVVNSRNEGEKLDWENCSIYFLIETKKLGEVGILLSATERNLSITIKNDRPGFKEKMEPLVDQCKESLKGIGYNVSGIHFTKLDAKQEQQTEQVSSTLFQPIVNPSKIPTTKVTAKGFDFKI